MRQLRVFGHKGGLRGGKKSMTLGGRPKLKKGCKWRELVRRGRGFSVVTEPLRGEPEKGEEGRQKNRNPLYDLTAVLGPFWW